MSNRVLNWVFEESSATGNDRLVLIAIADEADDDGTNAYPSVDRIARKARVPKRTTLRCLQRLEESGGLVVSRPDTRGRGHFNTYVVVMNGATLSPEETARNGATGDDKRRGKARDASQTVLDPLTLGSKDPAPPASAAPQRGTRISDQFFLTRDMRAWAAEHAPNVNVERETTKFVNYWRAKTRDATKLDWPATWRNWILNADDRAPARRGGRQTLEDVHDTIERGVALAEAAGIFGPAPRCDEALPIEGIA